jgi:hypothetical protein
MREQSGRRSLLGRRAAGAQSSGAERQALTPREQSGRRSLLGRRAAGAHSSGAERQALTPRAQSGRRSLPRPAVHDGPRYKNSRHSSLSGRPAP